MSDKLKEKAVKMTNMRKYLVLGVAMASAIVTGLAFAQDDLDDLLKDLEAETTKPKSAEAPAPVATVSQEAPAPEVKAEEPAVKAEEPAKTEAPASFK